MKPATSQHSPTPWEMSRNRHGVLEIWRGDTLITAVEGVGKLSRELNEANAAFIVRAVNAHDSLLTLLKQLRNYKGFIEQRSFWDAVDKAIARAEGTEVTK